VPMSLNCHFWGISPLIRYPNPWNCYLFFHSQFFIILNVSARMGARRFRPRRRSRRAKAVGQHFCNSSLSYFISPFVKRPQKAQKAHCAIERSASSVPWVISAITCALIAVAASAIIIRSERVSIRREFSEQFQSLPEVYRTLAKQGRTLQLVDSPDGTQQLVLSGKADSAFVVNDRAVMQFR
jgi:hypothetical protein